MSIGRAGGLPGALRVGGLRAGALGAAALGAAALGLLALAGPAQARDHGLTGMWLLTQGEYDPNLIPPLKPEVAALAEARRKAVEDGKVLSDNNKKCLPIGMPGMMTNEFALEVLETADRVTILSENSPLPRSIYLDAKTHPDDQEPSWNGHSIGRWDGDALVVDTVNFNGRAVRIHSGGISSGLTSTTLHLTERLHVEKGGQVLVDDMTFEDPVNLTKPWVRRQTYRRMPPGSQLWEYVCEVDSRGWSERYAGDPEAAKAVK